MVTAFLVIIVGVVGIATSAIVTHSYWNRAGLHSYEARSASAGQGIVPSWVSFLNMGSWAGVVLGAIALLYGWFGG